MYGKGQGASVIPNDYSDVKQQVSTGSLPEKARIEELLQDVHARYADIDEGMLAYYIPILGEVDPSLFAVALSNVGGNVLCAGDVNYEFSIQSISKMFVYALVLQELGHDAVRDYIGVNNTGMSFNSVMAIELNEGHPMNPWSMPERWPPQHWFRGRPRPRSGRTSANASPPSPDAT
nr:glutaminase [Arthrobacter sp. JCM 19049]